MRLDGFGGFPGWGLKLLDRLAETVVGVGAETILVVNSSKRWVYWEEGQLFMGFEEG